MICVVKTCIGDTVPRSRFLTHIVALVTNGLDVREAVPLVHPVRRISQIVDLQFLHCGLHTKTNQGVESPRRDEDATRNIASVNWALRGPVRAHRGGGN